MVLKNTEEFDLNLSLKKIYATLLFSISPLIGLFFLLNKINRNHLNLLYIFIALFFSLILLKSPPIDDLYRYLQLFDRSESYIILSFQDVSSYTTYYILAKLYNILGIPFFYIPFFYVFISIYFYLKTADVVFKKNIWSLRYYLLVLLGMVVIVDPILASLGLRFSAASALFSYGALLILIENNKKGFIYLFISILFHLSIAYLVVFLLISFFVNINKKVALIFSLISLLISGFFMNLVADYIPFVNISQQFIDYLDNKGTGYDPNAVLGTSAIFVVFLSRSKNIIFWIFYYFSREIENRDFVKFSNGLNILSIAVCLSAMTSIVFFRYAFGVLPLIYIFMAIVFYKNKGAISLMFVSIFIFIQFIVIDVYIKKDSIIYGEPVKMAVFPVFQILNYTDDEYRKHLMSIDEDGYYLK